MRTNATQTIRALLRAHPDGLSTTEVAGRVNRNAGNMGKLLRSMPDAYVDRWIGPVRGQYTAVWCVVVPPADCPHPRRGR